MCTALGLFLLLFLLSSSSLVTVSPWVAGRREGGEKRRERGGKGKKARPCGEGEERERERDIDIDHDTWCDSRKTTGDFAK